MPSFETTLRKYLDTFSNQEMYFVNDARNIELFNGTPNNDNAVDIRTKVSAINDPEILEYDLADDMIAHILKLSIDSRLQKGDLTLVENIAQIQSKGKSFNVLHFASVYCNYHKPDIYPIYSDQYHNFYKRYIKEYKLPLDPEKITAYNVFSQALNDLVKRLNLVGKMDYLHLRKFAWLYAESVLSESNK